METQENSHTSEVGGRKESTTLMKDNLKQNVGGINRSPELLYGKNTTCRAGVRRAEQLGNRISHLDS